MGRRGRKLVATRYTADAMVDGVSSVYEEVL
jgi:hypothetical protein